MSMRNDIDELVTNGWIAVKDGVRGGVDIWKAITWNVGRMGYGDRRVIVLRGPYGDVKYLSLKMRDDNTIGYDIVEE